MQTRNSGKTEGATAGYSSGLYQECLVSDVQFTQIVGCNIFQYFGNTLSEYFCLQLKKIKFQDGAQTSIYCSVSEDVADITGKYFAGCKFANCSPLSQDKELARKLWFKSIEIVELLPQETVVWI